MFYNIVHYNSFNVVSVLQFVFSSNQDAKQGKHIQEHPVRVNSLRNTPASSLIVVNTKHMKLDEIKQNKLDNGHIECLPSYLHVDV